MLRVCAKNLLEKQFVLCGACFAKPLPFHSTSTCQLTAKKYSKGTTEKKVTAPSTPTLQKPSAGTSSQIEVVEKDGVREITLNQPCSHNPLTMSLLSALHNELKKDLSNEKLRAIVISASGQEWSSGYDWTELSGDDKKFAQDIIDKTTEIVMTIQSAPVPVIAKVHGAVQGAAMQIISACDIVVASDSASFAASGVDVGVFDSAAGAVLSRSMPRQKGLHMLMTGQPMCAFDAFNAGLVTLVVPRCRLDEVVNSLVGCLKSKSRAAIADGKEFFNYQLNLSPQDALLCGGQHILKSLSTPDAKEGLRAFLEKRQPKWTHKSK